MLLAIAVILPTICLLWFMTQAVKNERLAIRQKLIDSYTARGQEIFHKSAGGFINDTNNLSSSVIYREQTITSVSETIRKIEKLEFSDVNYVEAMKEYEKIAQISSISDDVYKAAIGQIRCIIKQDKIDDAIKKCRQCVYDVNLFSDEQTAKAGLLLVNLYSNTKYANLSEELQRQFSVVSKTDIPTETQVFILGELIKMARQSGLGEKLQTEIDLAQKFIDSATLSIIAADYLNQNTALSSQPDEIFFKIPATPPLYGVYLKTGDKKNLCLLTDEKMTQLWQKSVNDFTDELVFCRICDADGRQIAGEKAAAGENFATLNLKNYFAGWKIELYLRSGIFKEAADKKMYIYFWVASIVIVLMFSSTLLAGKAVLKQARLNKLKNDFIATITHELKTPLSSMRVLVDTLLEGRCENREQETEYLQLISKENIRLSKLIDNFLTFSRMERNKQVFDIAAVSPVEIANNAAEAMQTKFEKSNVRFSLNVLKPLPMVEADKDAMVTVLVNLLDNAYKYSNNDKQIELDVFAEDANICFSVKDNGIGMTRKQTRKIFDRFYQADTSLSRRAEGAGLGLSIVKFIVEAHKGKINVESKLGKGSIFMVKIPIIL